MIFLPSEATRRPNAAGRSNNKGNVRSNICGQGKDCGLAIKTTATKRNRRQRSKGADLEEKEQCNIRVRTRKMQLDCCGLEKLRKPFIETRIRRLKLCSYGSRISQSSLSVLTPERVNCSKLLVKKESHWNDCDGVHRNIRE